MEIKTCKDDLGCPECQWPKCLGKNGAVKRNWWKKKEIQKELFKEVKNG